MADGRTLITVRGEAQRTVDPDVCVLHARIQVRRGGRPDALDALSLTQRRLTDALAGLGGARRTADTDRQPLTWVVGSVHTYQEHPQTTLGRKARLVASLQLTVRVRDFTLLDRAAGLITAGEDVFVDHVAWDLDVDNAAEREVRAEAVHAALARGRDYAGALGARITAVEQLADNRMIGYQPEATFRSRAVRAGGPGEAAGDPPELVLDPQPQQVSAEIEARLIATGVDLTAH